MFIASPQWVGRGNKPDMKRKINRVGPSTLTVSLPSKWAKRYGLRKGDEITVEEAGTNLIIATQSIPQAQHTTLDVRHLQPMTRRAFDAIYKKGYDEVEIAFEKPDDLKDVEAAIDQEARTFEIVSVTKGKCLVKSISEISDDEFDTILRRTFLLLVDMGKGILQAWQDKDYSTIEHLRQSEITNNKFTHLLRRALNKKGYKEYKNTNLLYTIIEQLEKIADEFKFLCEYLSTNKLPPTAESMAIFKDVNAMLELYTTLFYKYEQKDAVTLGILRKTVTERATKAIETKKGKDAMVIHYLLNVCNMTFDMFGPLMAMRY